MELNAPDALAKRQSMQAKESCTPTSWRELKRYRLSYRIQVINIV